MPEKDALSQNRSLDEVHKLLYSALAMLDTRGTDETVSKVLTITNRAFINARNENLISSEQLYLEAIEAYENTRLHNS